MFDKKVNSLLEKKSPTIKKEVNGFINAGLKKSAVSLSGNGAVKFSTTGNDLVDQFGTAAKYKSPRSYSDIAKDMSILWAEDPLAAMKFVIYLRIITRNVQLPNGTQTESPARGQGLKHESIFRMMWVGVEHPKVFWKNINLFLAVGSWKDIITMLSYDLQYNGWNSRKLDWDSIGMLILAGLENENTNQLILKYLPQIKSNSICNTLSAQADNVIAKWLCSIIFQPKKTKRVLKNAKPVKEFATYKQYRQLKTSGTAHEWQKIISQGRLTELDFTKIHGRALSLIVTSKFLKNNGLEAKYAKWIEKQPTAKYTGYVYELLCDLKNQSEKYKIDTIDKQFDGLVETAKKGANSETSLIVVRDTSGSMGSAATGTKYSAGDVAKSIAIFLAQMLPDGKFANSWIDFNAKAELKKWRGKKASEMWNHDNGSGYCHNTDFMSVINLFAQIKQQGVAESEFPTGIICISDGQFDKTQLGKTNVEVALNTLKSAGFSKKYIDNYQIILWDVPNGYYGSVAGKAKFETFGDVKNVFYIGGLDASVIAFITGIDNAGNPTPKTASELVNAALSQEVMSYVLI